MKTHSMIHLSTRQRTAPESLFDSSLIMPNSGRKYIIWDFFWDYFPEYCKKHQVDDEKRKIMNSIIACRTGNLGYSILTCKECGTKEYYPYSCGSRYCPSCGTLKQMQWIAKQEACLIPEIPCGTVPDPVQVNPIGLNGGRLAEAMSDLLYIKDGDLMFGSMYMEDVLELIDWASEFKVSKPKKSILNPGVPSTQQIIEFKDKYLKDTASFTGYDASEGALYVLFMLSLAMHEKAPKMFAIDSFDHALNPRLAKKVTEIFCQKVIDQKKTVFMTTHNPLVLDGLDLTNEDIRLFTTDRNKDGHVEIRRIQVSDSLLKMNQPLSRLWINGLIGGVPELL